MITELVVWALVVKNDPKQRVVDIYSNETVCSRDARAVTKAVGQVFVCVPRLSTERPKE